MDFLGSIPPFGGGDALKLSLNTLCMKMSQLRDMRLSPPGLSVLSALYGLALILPSLNRAKLLHEPDSLVSRAKLLHEPDSLT